MVPKAAPRLSCWEREESLTGHVVLVQLLEGEGDVVQLRQGHPEVLQDGPFLLLQEGDGEEECQMPPLPQGSLQDAVTQHQPTHPLWAYQAPGSAGLSGAGCEIGFPCPEPPKARTQLCSHVPGGPLAGPSNNPTQPSQT